MKNFQTVVTSNGIPRGFELSSSLYIKIKALGFSDLYEWGFNAIEEFKNLSDRVSTSKNKKDLEKDEQILEIIKNYDIYKNYVKKLRNLFAETGKLNCFDDIHWVFTKNQFLEFEDIFGLRRVGKYICSNVHKTLFGEFIDIELELVSYIGKKYEITTSRVRIYKKNFNCEKPKIAILTDSNRDYFINRGWNFCSLLQTENKCYYYNAIGLKNLKRIAINERVLIDPDYYQLITNNTDFDSMKIELSNSEITDLRDEDVMRLPGFISGISLYNKYPLFVDLEKLQPVNWNENVFDHLEIEEIKKNLILKTINSYSKLNCDEIKGKNDGLIFLLVGNPGVGKTLTAEAVSEFLKKPLYKISIGDLGSRADLMEENLKVILERAMYWNAILLIDECDVFLEKRSSSNLEQNYCISIFLRLLEYFDGILFLTTNRIQTMDPAFVSRITIPLYYSDLDLVRECKIITNLLNHYNASQALSQNEIEKLAEFKFNGRQLKSIVKIAVSISLSENRQMIAADIFDAANLHKSFKRAIEKFN